MKYPLGASNKMVSIGNEHLTEITKNDCCGNGCSNCILDTKPSSNHRVDKTGKKNIILNYSKYKLLRKTLHLPSLNYVFEMHFVSADMSKAADYILDIPSGHHLMMRALIGNDAEKTETKYMCRPYSPYWVHTTNLEFKILVNLKPNGPMSQYIAKMSEGDQVEFRGPIGSIELAAKSIDSPQCFFIITQGVAIAPVLPVLEQLLADEESVNRIFYFGCFQDLNHVYFREQLLEYNKYWNFKGSIYLSRQKCESACASCECTIQCEDFRKRLRYKEPVYTRRLDVKELEDICRRAGKAEKIFIICGTRQFQDNFAESIKNMKVYNDGEKIYML